MPSQIRNPTRRELRAIDEARGARAAALEAARAADAADVVEGEEPREPRVVRLAYHALLRGQARTPAPHLAALHRRMHVGIIGHRKYIAALRAFRASGKPAAPPRPVPPRSDFADLLAAMRQRETAPTPALRKLLGRVRRGEMPRAKYDAALGRHQARAQAAAATPAA